MSAPDELIAGRYRLVNRVGRGGMGVVWEAWDERLHRRVAVKQLHPQPGLSEAEAELGNLRAMREARITARLDHPHAVPVFDVVEHEGQPCLIMQFLPSTPLSEVLRERHTLSLTETARIGAQIASALAAAHRAGIVHRDVKPGNVLIAADQTARISDFGISHAHGDSTLTATGMVHGTPAYLAPEVARGGDSTFASDVFGLGATLYTAREGEPPFGKDQNSIALLYRVASGNFTPPTQSGTLTPLVLQMLSPDPGDRPDMTEVARSLTTLAVDSGAEPDTLKFAEADVATQPTRLPPGSASGAPSKPVVERPWGGPATAGETAVAPAVPAANASRSTPPPLPPPSVPVAGSPARRARPLLWVTIAIAALLGLSVLAYGLITGPAGAGGVTGATLDPPAASPSPASSSSPSATRESPSATTTSPSASQTPSESPAPSQTESETPTPSRTESSAASRSPSADDSQQENEDEDKDEEQGDDGDPTARELARAVTSYYAGMPQNTDRGWSRLTSSYQGGRANGRRSYNRFWGGIERVSVTNVAGTPPNRVVATVTYVYRSGRVVRERTSYRLVNDDGVLKINSSSVLSSATQ
ncbi:MAG TPA: serine/threonine-protein kinase [Propionibacteriaceae bacterium]|nr:serine/threonine-protein kinase [Propionibacteriaceae bacterium]